MCPGDVPGVDPRESRSRKCLGLLATPFGQALRAFALSCDDLRSLWSRSNLHARPCKFFTVWPPNPSLFASSTGRYLRLLASPFDEGFRASQKDKAYELMRFIKKKDIKKQQQQQTSKQTGKTKQKQANQSINEQMIQNQIELIIFGHTVWLI